MKLSGRTVLVTGASGGLGQAIARELSGRGARLLLTGRRAELLEELARELGGEALTVDLADAGAVARMVAGLPQVDVLVANAGLPASGPVDDFSIEEIDRALDVNLRAPIVLARELAPAMVERGEGHLVFISSLNGLTAPVGTALYSATKYGLRGFATALRADLHGTGVGVSTVFPGFISDAGMWAEAGVALPPGVRMKPPGAVSRAVARAIERNRAEVVVAPAPLRLGALIGAVAPELAAAFSRRAGASELSEQVGAAQRQKR
jgi:short-subunit dehydrogenase